LPPAQKSPLEPEKLSTTVMKIGETVQKLRFGSGFNMRAITILLARETKVSERTVKRVLEGINELHKHYFEKET
jgi:hypothetical protein